MLFPRRLLCVYHPGAPDCLQHTHLLELSQLCPPHWGPLKPGVGKKDWHPLPPQCPSQHSHSVIVEVAGLQMSSESFRGNSISYWLICEELFIPRNTVILTKFSLNIPITNLHFLSASVSLWRKIRNSFFPWPLVNGAPFLPVSLQVPLNACVFVPISKMQSIPGEHLSFGHGFLLDLVKTWTFRSRQ